LVRYALVATLCFLLGPKMLVAEEVTICNQTGGDIYISFAHEDDSGKATVAGWFQMLSGQCSPFLSSFPLPRRRFFLDISGITTEKDDRGLPRIKKLKASDFTFCTKLPSESFLLSYQSIHTPPSQCDAMKLATEQFQLVEIGAQRNPVVNINCSGWAKGSFYLDCKAEIRRAESIAAAPPSSPSPPSTPAPSANVPLWTADCLCRRGSEWAANFVQNPIGSPPAVGSIVILQANGKACYPSACDDGVSITSGNQRVKVKRTFVTTPNTMVYTFSIFGDAFP
jgi:hypothetical protein